MSGPRVRLGSVPWLNARPLMLGLEQGIGRGRVDIRHAVPSALADALAGGELDVALLPSVELARIPGLEVVPGLAIGSRGAVRSVLLVSRVDPFEIATLALDPDSRTSNVLAQVLLADCWGVRPEVVEGEADAVVRIGDKALFDPVAPGLHVLDLGQVWTELTGSPFVFAVWAGRAGVVDAELYRMLHESRRIGSAAIDAIAQDVTWKGVRQEHLAAAYLRQSIRYRLGSAELDAVRRFLARAAALGLAPQPPTLRLALERWTSCHDMAVR